MNYKVGDRVRVRKDLKAGEHYGGWCFNRNMSLLAGSELTITKVHINKFSIDNFYSVKESCWSFTDEMFESVEKEPAQNWKVVIVPNGETTTALLYDGKTVVKKAEVKRYHKDAYSISEAVKEVTKKLFGEVDGEEYNGFKIGQKVVFTCENIKMITGATAGRVIGFNKDDNFLLVEFDKELSLLGHDGGSYEIKGRKGKKGYCLYCKPEYLKVVE